MRLLITFYPMHGDRRNGPINLNGLEADSLATPLLIAAVHYHSPSYLEMAKKLEQTPTAEVLLLEKHAREETNIRKLQR